ncbi:uncharacterized protein KY384_007471 [Bacidia gigantensis]|uniref:uncharacterized protein n=1 Tax=Bacidia gigantensis TaxID=2732470 RepID=UPI001D047A13|nr:uncharacterized protein KY384_007470 [Bacidia gigantensis]XP_044666602.1 uncharacterized protein KY384_007471 [Bacidia gigantensis]KAG8527318.1 hypothetical protein KY384_007470 [Bacidia gigantensis]KAG8527319.1 hypothetical protein KY384_007471 [Bacidia gigantensis]
MLAANIQILAMLATFALYAIHCSLTIMNAKFHFSIVSAALTGEPLTLRLSTNQMNSRHKAFFMMVHMHQLFMSVVGVLGILMTMFVVGKLLDKDYRARTLRALVKLRVVGSGTGIAIDGYFEKVGNANSALFKDIEEGGGLRRMVIVNERQTASKAEIPMKLWIGFYHMVVGLIGGYK